MELRRECNQPKPTHQKLQGKELISTLAKLGDEKFVSEGALKQS